MTEQLKFMDFCAGIGAGRLGLEKNNLSCVGYSEIDRNSIKTYITMHDCKTEKNYNDLTKIKTDILPHFEVMIAGFPCQTFSIIGERKGFDDYRGQIIYSLIDILKNKNVPYFILENVKGLVTHNRGKTLKEILSSLEEAGYKVYWQVLNSINYGVPQMRERVYFVGIRKDKINTDKKFNWPKTIKTPDLKEYLVDDNSKILDYPNDQTFNKYLNNKYNKGKHDIDELLNEDYLILDTRQSDLRLYRGKVPTLRTGRHGILYVKNKKLHKLSGYESVLLQGFDEEYAKKVINNIDDKNLLAQAGNAMTVKVIELIGKSLLEYIEGV